jgi:hypothetical protein
MDQRLGNIGEIVPNKYILVDNLDGNGYDER